MLGQPSHLTLLIVIEVVQRIPRRERSLHFDRSQFPIDRHYQVQFPATDADVPGHDRYVPLNQESDGDLFPQSTELPF